ncbi:hypothetical protein P7K49_020654, partial [Saguinus oedipus]
NGDLRASPRTYWIYAQFMWSSKRGLRVSASGTLSTCDTRGKVPPAYGDPDVNLGLGSGQDWTQHYENGALDEFNIQE